MRESKTLKKSVPDAQTKTFHGSPACTSRGEDLVSDDSANDVTETTFLRCHRETEDGRSVFFSVLKSTPSVHTTFHS